MTTLRALLRPTRRATPTAMTSADVHRVLARLPAERGRAMRDRLDTLVGALRADSPPADVTHQMTANDARAGDPLQFLLDALRPARSATVWLTLAVLTAELPDDPTVIAAVRAITLDGPEPFLAALMPTRAWTAQDRTVEVLTGATVVDLEHTAHTALATGIQRVARQAAVRWDRDHDLTLVGWTADQTALRRLSALEQNVALRGAEHDPGRGPDSAVLVPWHATYLLPELATEHARTSRLLALARHSGSRTAVVGFDCVPLSTAETIGLGMGAAFSGNLAALRHVDRVVAISDAAATEYLGWRDMLAGTGLPGPDVVAVPLAVEAGEPPADVLADAASRLGTDVRPLVLCVGSHEPRKNHVAVLEAAERCWRGGKDFSLLFVGGNAWMSEEFEWRMADLAAAGRRVSSVSAISDTTLWAAYRLARCVVFPSLNEGFGLPVAESIAVGTPVITSGFGSMRELAAHGGAVLVDPRDDDHLTAALERLLSDDELHGRLSREAAAAPRRSWDEYAAEAWQALVTP